MTYFDNEESHENICNKSCDVCMSNRNMQPTNRSDAAKEHVCCLEEVQKIQTKVRTKLLGLTYWGSKSNVITSKGFQQVSYYGKRKFSDRELQKLRQCAASVETILSPNAASVTLTRFMTFCTTCINSCPMAFLHTS